MYSSSLRRCLHLQSFGRHVGALAAEVRPRSPTFYPVCSEYYRQFQIFISAFLLSRRLEYRSYYLCFYSQCLFIWISAKRNDDLDTQKCLCFCTNFLPLNDTVYVDETLENKTHEEWRFLLFWQAYCLLPKRHLKALCLRMHVVAGVTPRRTPVQLSVTVQSARVDGLHHCSSLCLMQSRTKVKSIPTRWSKKQRYVKFFFEAFAVFYEGLVT